MQASSSAQQCYIQGPLWPRAHQEVQDMPAACASRVILDGTRQLVRSHAALRAGRGESDACVRKKSCPVVVAQKGTQCSHTYVCGIPCGERAAVLSTRVLGARLTSTKMSPGSSCPCFKQASTTRAHLSLISTFAGSGQNSSSSH